MRQLSGGRRPLANLNQGEGRAETGRRRYGYEFHAIQSGRAVDRSHPLRQTRRRPRLARSDHAGRGRAGRSAIERAGVDPGDVEHAIFGQVLQAGAGQNPARQVVFKANLAKTVTAETVNKVCASGLLAIVYAMRAIDAGARSVVAAGGMESMSNAPYLLRNARFGYRFGDGDLVDAMIYDGLWDQYFPMTMSSQGNKVATELGCRAKTKIASRWRATNARTKRTTPGISTRKSFRCASPIKRAAKSCSTRFRAKAKSACRRRSAAVPTVRAACGNINRPNSSRSTTKSGARS